MFSSLKLGKIFGIDLYVHGTFWLLPLFILFSGMAGGAGLAKVAVNLAFIFVVFACVVLHECGHALAARGYGIGTRDITLYPVGGVAALERIPEKPSREIAIALAGPAVNLVIAATLFVGLLGTSAIAPASLSTAGPLNEFEAFAVEVMIANVVLFVFNLLPCFPMDGGRVLRAVLATRLTRVRATEVAVRVGTVVAIGLGIYGLVSTNFFLVALAFMVYMLGQAELAMVRGREAARMIHDRVREFFTPADAVDDGRAPGPGDPPSPGFSGLAWDATRHAWVEWKNGVRVGALPPSS
jgi:Zn-dependent protease